MPDGEIANQAFRDNTQENSQVKPGKIVRRLLLSRLIPILKDHPVRERISHVQQCLVADSIASPDTALLSIRSSPRVRQVCSEGDETCAH